VTETIVTEYITYLDKTTIETVVTEKHTVNQTKTVTGDDSQPITLSTPTFTVEVTSGVTLSFNAGPTYVIYNHLYGGADDYGYRHFFKHNQTQKFCMPKVRELKSWQPANTALQDWNYFVATHTESLPNNTETSQFRLPTQAIEYLEQQPAIRSQFHGLDLASCSTTTPSNSGSLQLTLAPPPAAPPSSGFQMNPPLAPVPTPTSKPPMMSPTTGTYLSTTYESTSVHNTVRGCLRCIPDSPATIKIGLPSPTPADTPDADNIPSRPSEPNNPTGDTANPLNVPRPIQIQTDRPGHQDQDTPNFLPPVVVVGGQTLKPGQTQTVDGVPVVFPATEGAPRIIVGSTTVTYDAAVTSAPPMLTASGGRPVLTVGGGTIVANPQGEFVFGSETLKPGGVSIVVNGNTVSLGSNGIAVVNGVTQTMPGAPAPPATITPPPPAPVASDRTVFTTSVGGLTVFVVVPGQAVGAGSWVVTDGTTAYVPAPGQTLTPGGALTIAGTTYSLPEGAPGGVVVVNGVTSTMTPGAVITSAPALTINDIVYTQTVRDGTTEYVLGEGTTLAPGSTVEMDGTTYSLDEAGTALVINGHTSNIPTLPKSNSASTTSSSVASTTTSRDAGDLIASGVGVTSKGAGASFQNAGIDKWVESLVIGAASWLMMLL
jgi:hypothetical protein